jgi:hypothetical protein
MIRTPPRRSIFHGLALGALAVVFSAAAALPPGSESAGDEALSQEELTRLFDQARGAYDAGALDEAVNTYRDLLERGYISSALFFNLGNAYFKGGFLGAAILNYRRALYLAPRDPDVLKNLEFAVETAGTSLPQQPLLEALSLKMSFGEWVGVAVLAYWGAAVAGGLSIASRRRRSLWLRILLAFAVVLGGAATGLAHRAGLRRTPEVVVLEPGQEALYAPLEGSTAHFAVPEGMILRMTDSSEGWVKVQSEKKSGWIRRPACQTVYPFR